MLCFLFVCFVNVFFDRLLLEAGLSVSALDDEAYSALHLASAGGHTDVVRLLLQTGATPDCSTERNHRPLHLAAQYGHSAVVKVCAPNFFNTTRKSTHPFFLFFFDFVFVFTRWLVETRCKVQYDRMLLRLKVWRPKVCYNSTVVHRRAYTYYSFVFGGAPILHLRVGGAGGVLGCLAARVWK